MSPASGDRDNIGGGGGYVGQAAPTNYLAAGQQTQRLIITGGDGGDFGKLLEDGCASGLSIFTGIAIGWNHVSLQCLVLHRRDETLFAQAAGRKFLRTGDVGDMTVTEADEMR